MTPEMQEALQRLEGATQQLDADRTRQSLRDLSEQQKRMREQLEKSAEMLKRAALEGQMQTVSDQAKELAKAQQEFADSEKFETLRSIRFFEDFSDVELWEVVRFSGWDRVTPETVIMKDGEPGDYFCFIAEGEVKVAKRGRMLNVLTAGECFGEMAVIGRNNGGRNADVIAVTDAKIVTIRGNALHQASEVCRMHFYAAFLEVLANRLALANARLASV